MHAQKKGFTLAEVMVSLAIIAGLLGAGAAGMVILRSSIISGSNHLEAQSLAFDQAWGLFSPPLFSTLQTLASGTNNISTVAVPTNSCLYSAGGTMRTALAAAPDGSYCDIQVTVNWVQRAYGKSTAASETYYVRRYNTGR
jgi:prepilin-type N-terminal cleavage/methylation domain-containing protein